jgi:hypothetical protein
VWNIDFGQICIESVEAEGVIRLTGGRPLRRQPLWTTSDGLEITERTTTILNIWGIDWLLWCHSRFLDLLCCQWKKINSLYGNILTKIIICISTEKVLCITRLENVFASACTCDASADASAPTNHARSCKMTFSSLVIQITTYFHFIVSFNDLDFFFFTLMFQLLKSEPTTSFDHSS